MRRSDSQPALIAQLALRDYLHEWVMSACFVMALAAVLLPLLVLFGLKFGIITNLLTPLTEDPRYRQILPAGSGRYGADWFEVMRARSDVEFIVPRTRSISATLGLRVPDSPVGRIIDVELIPSAVGDPMLGQLPEPSGRTRVVLSRDAADKLGAVPGTRAEGILTRVYRGQQQTELLPLEVVGVASAAAFGRDGVFVSGELLVAVEDYRDGRAVSAFGWAGGPARDGSREFSGFRLFARRLEDVAGLRHGLMQQGIDVRTRSGDIDLVQSLDRNLSIVFWIIAIVAAVGYGVSFGSNVWANVDRKRREFSVLRLTGFRTRSIVWFPILQAMLSGLLGWLVAVVGFYGVQAGLNALFLDNVGGGQPVCRILASHLGIALFLTLLAAAAAAALGGVRVAKLEPSLALRAG